MTVESVLSESQVDHFFSKLDVLYCAVFWNYIFKCCCVDKQMTEVWFIESPYVRFNHLRKPHIKRLRCYTLYFLYASELENESQSIIVLLGWQELSL